MKLAYSIFAVLLFIQANSARAVGGGDRQLVLRPSAIYPAAGSLVHSAGSLGYMYLYSNYKSWKQSDTDFLDRIFISGVTGISALLLSSYLKADHRVNPAYRSHIDLSIVGVSAATLFANIWKNTHLDTWYKSELKACESIAPEQRQNACILEAYYSTRWWSFVATSVSWGLPIAWLVSIYRYPFWRFIVAAKA